MALEKACQELLLPEGVSKDVLRQAPECNWDTPKSGDEVHIQYTGCLDDGSQFEPSRNQNGDFHFILGQGEVAKGLDLGIATMRKLEKARFVLEPDFAYGDVGIPPKVPPKATVTFEVELLAWTRRDALTSDGKVLKTLESAGWGLRKPAPGDAVRLRYEGFVEGDEAFVRSEPDGVDLDLSSDNPLKLPVATLQLVLSTMLEGETAMVRLHSTYAYGDSPGFNGKVPAGSSVCFRLCLLNVYPVELCGFFKEKSAVSSKHFPTVKKKELKAGTGYDRPSDLSRVRVLVNGVEAEWILLLGGRCEAIECAVLEMTIGSSCIITVDNASVCLDKELGLAPKTGETQIEIRLELLDFESVEHPCNLSRAQRIERGSKLKAQGALYMKANDWRRACRIYRAVQDLFGYIEDWDEDERRLADSLRQTSKSNEVMTWLRLEQYRDAEELCTEILDGGGISKPDPTNIKALYRRGQALLGLKEAESARADFLQVLELDPQNAEAKQQLAQAGHVKQVQKRAEQALSRNMMAGVGDLGYTVGCKTPEGERERELEAMRSRVDQINAAGTFVI